MMDGRFCQNAPGTIFSDRHHHRQHFSVTLYRDFQWGCAGLVMKQYGTHVMNQRETRNTFLSFFVQTYVQ